MPRRAAFLHCDGRSGGLRVFLNDDGIGAVGQQCSGEDAHGLPGSDPAVKGPARRRGPDHREIGRHRGHVGGPHGVAVHRGNGLGRLGQTRMDVRGQYPAESFVDADGLRGKRLEVVENAAQSFFD